MNKWPHLTPWLHFSFLGAVQVIWNPLLPLHLFVMSLPSLTPAAQDGNVYI